MGAIQRVAGTLPIALDSHHSPARGFLGPRWVTFGRSRVRESRTLGSVGAKAEWLSYPTILQTAPARGICVPRIGGGRRVNVLWAELPGHAQTSGLLRGQNPERCEARRPACGAADEV